MASPDVPYRSFLAENLQFLELRADLGKRVLFQTGTDTEVILALYREYGRRIFHTDERNVRDRSVGRI